MRLICLIFTILLFSSSFAQTLSKNQLKSQIVNSHLVVEGEIITGVPYEDISSGLIYTVYTVNIYKVFQGEISISQTQIRSLGGETADRFVFAPHWPKLHVGQRGILFLREHSEENVESYLMPSYQTLPYYQFGGKHVASFDRKLRGSVTCELYPLLEEIIGNGYQVLAFTPEEIAEAEWLAAQGKETIALRSSDASIEYTFVDEIFTGTNHEFLEFNIAAHTNALYSEYGHAEIRIKYDTTTFGTYIIGNGDFEATKEEIIQSNDYILDAYDLSANEVMLSIDVTTNPIDLYELTSQAEDLLHVKVDISGVTNWGMITFLEDSIYTDFYIPSTAVFDEVNDIIADDSIHAGVSSANPTDITFFFENEQVTGTNPKFLEFDVYAQASDTGSYLFAAQVYFTYNASAFGPSIKMNSKLTVTPGSLISNLPTSPAYNISINDNLANRVSINVSTLAPNSLPALLEAPLVKDQLLHVKVEIANCNFRPEIEFDQALMAAQSYYKEASNFTPGNIIQYANVQAIDLVNPALCPGNAPYISSISPLVVRGGVGDSVTLYGGNFGNNPSVLLPNMEAIANQSAFKYYFIDPAFISNNSNDSIIKFAFPSTDGVGTLRVFGSGNVIVRNGGSDDTSFQAIDVRYTIMNYKPFPTNTYYRPALASLQGGGYEFRVDSSVTNQPGASACVNRALEIWQCATQVNFFRGTDTAMVFSDPALYQNVNAIALVPSIFFPAPGTIGGAIITGGRIADCNSTGVYLIEEIDILFNRDFLTGNNAYVFDTSATPTIPAARLDFIGLLVHEIGHAHLLHHVADSLKTMYPAAPLGTTRFRNLSFDDIDGGIHVMLTNNRLNLATGCNTDSMVWFPPCSSTGIQPLEKTDFFTIYPNPFRDELIIARTQYTSNTAFVTLFDVSGKKCFESIFQPNQTFLNINVVDKNFSSGIYLLKIRTESGYVTKKIIKE